MRKSQVLNGECGQCGSRLQVKTHSSEKVVDCPKCNHRVTITATSTTLAAAAPRPAVPVAKPKRYVFGCPNCDSDVDVEHNRIGQTTTCRSCEQPIRVPEPRRRSRRDDEDYDDEPARPAPGLTVGDWVVCILFPVIGFIAGFFRLVQGKPSGGAMMLYSMLFGFLWVIVRIVIEVAASK